MEKTEAYSHKPACRHFPICQGNEFGENLTEVAAFHHTTPEEIVRRHTEPVYSVFTVGFQPGFPYLGGLPENLYTSRRTVPQMQISTDSTDSVAIGGSQTGIYPFASPNDGQ